MILVTSVLMGGGAATVSGVLTERDAVDIRKVLLRERAPIVSRDFAPRGFAQFKTRIRERLAGKLVSVSSRDGEYARAEYRDRWNDGVAYSYDLHKLTNGWKVVGVGMSKRIE
jgi:hypothetical protein